MRAEDRSTAVGPLDAVQKDPAHHGVLLENEHVRVLDALLRPGEQTEIHTHVWPSALYVLSWSDFVRIDPQGKVIADSRTMHRPGPGDATASGAERGQLRPAAHRGRAQVTGLTPGKQREETPVPAIVARSGRRISSCRSR